MPVVMRLVVLGFFAEVFGEVPENRRSVRGPALKSGDATGTAPTGAALHTDNDVFVEESAFLQEPYGRFRREFIRPEFTDADEVAKAFSLFRLR